jgi:prophage maintenance system killer protein
MPHGHRWSPLADLPEDWSSLSDGELRALTDVWIEQSNELAAKEAVEEFTKRLCREWAIETGVIEGAYTLARGVTQTLIEQGIRAELIGREDTDRDPAEVAAMIQDHLDALDGLFAFVKGERELTVGYIKELHAALMRHQPTHRVQDQFGQFFDAPLEKGTYKTQPNNATRPDGGVHEYCPPEHVASEMDRLVALHREHVTGNVAAEIEAAWLHHVFTQIHPFADGNGRVARALASLVFLRRKAFPFVVRRDDRNRYIAALESADSGDIGAVVGFLVRSQRRSLIAGIHAIPTIFASQTGPGTVEEEVSTVRRLLLSKGEITPRDWESTKQIAGYLVALSSGRLNAVSKLLKTELAEFHQRRGPFAAYVGGGQAPTNLQSVAEALGYYPNVAEWHQGAELNLVWRSHTKIIVSLHALGKKYRGIIVAVLLYLAAGQATQILSEEMFQVNYKDKPEDAERRFQAWLEPALARALAMWRETL